MAGCSSVAVAVTGASGIVYAERLLEILSTRDLLDGVVVSSAARNVAETELGRKLMVPPSVKVYADDDFNSPYASSSGLPECMVIVPASMNTIAKIAWGISDNVITRAALGVLRLKRRLVVVPRETPLGLIELENMARLARAGAIVLPACPGFYTRARSIEDLIDFIVGKILDVLGVEHHLYERWGRGGA